MKKQFVCSFIFAILFCLFCSLLGITLKDFLDQNISNVSTEKFIAPSIFDFILELQKFMDMHEQSDFLNPECWINKENSHIRKILPIHSFSMTSECLLPFVQKDCSSSEFQCCLVGDIHGYFYALLNIFQDMKTKHLLDENYKVINPSNKFYFLGDYVDRGMNGVEVLYALVLFANENPKNVTLHRGNHESNSLNGMGQFCFWNELSAKFGIEMPFAKLAVLRFYEYLPVATYLTYGNKIIHCSHGGYSNGFVPTDLLIDSYCKFQQILPNIANDFLWTDFTCNADSYYSVLPNPARNNAAPILGIGVVETYIKVMNKYLSEKESDLNVACFFRGHQNPGCGLGLFGATTQPSDEGNNIKNWHDVVDKGAILFHPHQQKPIFTLNTAFENGRYSYCILTVFSEYENWVVLPIEG